MIDELLAWTSMLLVLVATIRLALGAVSDRPHPARLTGAAGPDAVAHVRAAD